MSRVVSSGIERLEHALERTIRSGTCRFRAEVAGTPLDGEIDLDGGIGRSWLGVSRLVQRPAPEQIHRGSTVYQRTGDVGDRPWVALPIGSGGSDPTGMLDLLRGVVSVRSGSDPGDPLDVEIDVEQACARADDPSAFRAWLEATGLPERLTATVRLDDGGRVRHVRSTLPAADDGRSGATPLEVSYDAFGDTVEIAVPPRHRLA